MKNSSSDLIKDLRALLLSGKAQNQDEICATLSEKHTNVNQSKISRLLRKLGAVKTNNADGKVVYALPKEPPPPTAMNSLENLVMSIMANEYMVVIHTSPGSASLIARMLDYQERKTYILATIAGDDTVAVMPKSIENIQHMLKEIKQVLGR